MSLSGSLSLETPVEEFKRDKDRFVSREQTSKIEQAWLTGVFKRTSFQTGRTNMIGLGLKKKRVIKVLQMVQVLAGV